LGHVYLINTKLSDINTILLRCVMRNESNKKDLINHYIILIRFMLQHCFFSFIFSFFFKICKTFCPIIKYIFHLKEKMTKMNHKKALSIINYETIGMKIKNLHKNRLKINFTYLIVLPVFLVCFLDIKHWQHCIIF
jgi:hypothetical protein